MAEKKAAAGTAQGPMIIAAIEQFLPPAQRIVDDPAALSMLSGSSRFFVNICRWSPIRRWLCAFSEKSSPGVWGGILSRKRFIDDLVAGSLTDGMGALVVLGAGFDSRGIRFALPAGLPAFEVDLPDNIADKRTALEAAGGVPSGLKLLPVDFETADLDKLLADAGYDATRPALFVWEGVTQYLTEQAFEKSLQFLSHAAPGSKLVFTYVLKDFIAGEDMHNAAPVYKHLVLRYKIWHFGMMPDDVPTRLAPHGWKLVSDVGAREHRAAYMQPVGRDLPVMEIERIVVAEKTH